MVRTLLVLFPLVIVVLGWMAWFRVRGAGRRGKRQHAIAMGLAAASISCVCYIGVVFYLQKASIGYWDEYLMAAAWGKFNWPLSALAGILGILGKGSGRILLVLAGCWLVLVWTMAFIH
jgi:divalent metal cation (Fe/Co/Zn/Cd) transporter